MNTPEKLNIWDRFFNRYRRVVFERGSETWYSYRYGMKLPCSEYKRNYVEYKIIDRLTGSERIEKEYLD